MFWLWSFLVFVGSWVVGVFGFCQIIGSVRIAKFRRTLLTVITVTIWSVLLLFLIFAVHLWLFNYRIACYLGLAIAFVMSFNTGKNGPER